MSTGLNDDEGRILHDTENMIMFAVGTAAPTADTAGYAVGCIFQATAGSVGEVLFTNVGTTAECNFAVVQSAGGALVVNTTRVAADYTVLDTDCQINVNSTLELRFSASPTTGQIWIVTVNSIAVEATASFEDEGGYINGVLTLTLGRNEAVQLISDGTNLHAYPLQAQLNQSTN